MLSDKALQEPWFVELRAEFNEALERTDGFAEGKPDRTDLMFACKRIIKGQVTIGEIIGAVSCEMRIPVGEITGHKTNGPITRARTLAMCLAHDLRPEFTNDIIAADFGRERSCVYMAVKRAQKLLDSDPEFCHRYQHVRWRLGLS